MPRSATSVDKQAVPKQAVVEEIRKQLERELSVILQAAKAAHEAATHSESKAEDQHDTRAIESSYLAGAQSQRAAELQQSLIFFRQFEPGKSGPPGSSKDPIGPGNLVELISGGKKSLFLIAQRGGGIRVSVDGKEVQVITPHSPMGEELLGKRKGDSVELAREYEITAVY